MTILFGLFLIAHGLVHGLYFVPNPPNDSSYPFFLTKSWFAKKVGKSSIIVGKILIIITICMFIASGIFLIGFSNYNYLWITFALLAAVISEFLFLLFWHKWLFIGFIINLIIIYITIQMM